jgi:uncharacterized protein with LGFP repeats
MTAIDDKYLELGGVRGFLGRAVGPELPTPNGLGSYRHYRGGSIYHKHIIPAAYEVHGLIREKWAELGWENSFLGFPIRDENDAGAGRGRISRFEGGVILWSPTTGAHELHGAIRARWEKPPSGLDLGFPLTDELATPDTVGRYNHFEKGSIYWTPTTGAFEVTSPVKEAWASAGWERGPLGYPVAKASEMTPTTSPTTFQDFQHGTMYCNVDCRTVVRSPWAGTSPGTVIDWGDLGRLLPDNDRILADFTGHATKGDIKIDLNLGRDVTWWKGISLWSPGRGELKATTPVPNTNNTKFTMTVSPSMVEPTDVFLLFKKAKTLGIHTDMYWLRRPDRLIGNHVTFTWARDT